MPEGASTADVQVRSPPYRPPQMEKQRKDMSWRTDVTQVEKVPRARAEAKTAANSLKVVTEI